MANTKMKAPTKNSFGVYVASKANFQVMDTADWFLAKTGDLHAAQNVIAQAWQDADTNEVRKRLSGYSPVFLTVPGTSGQNMVTPVLADRLCAAIGGQVLNGDDFFRHIEMRQIKHIAKKERIFEARKFDYREFPENLENSSFVLVEDVISSGVTVFSFLKFLQRHNIYPKAIIGMMGQARLLPGPQLASKLQSALKRLNLPIKASLFVDLLTREEVKNIVAMMNEAQKENIDAIAHTIQRIFDLKTAVFVGGCSE